MKQNSIEPAREGSPRKPRRRRAVAVGAAGAGGEAGLTQAQQLALYRVMLMSRRVDDVEIVLKRHNQIYFQISGAGHEASLAAAAMHLRPGHDWFFPYYRDRALCLGLGVTPEQLLLQAVGAAADPASGGRQMPSHWSRADLHIVSEASTTGTQYLSAVGCAEAGLYFAKEGAPAGRKFTSDEVVYCSSGEGATSQGVFFEALNTACMDRLPVLFHIEDNGWAISTPKERQTAGGSISAQVAGFVGLLRLEFDGCCPEASARAWAEGVAYARARRGPVLMHAHVVRPYSHSLSDDERLYRSDDDLQAQTARDPLPSFRARLLRELPDGAQQLMQLEAEVEATLGQARERALAAPPPAGETATRHVFCDAVDPRGPAFDSPPEHVGEPKTMVDLINACLRDEMQRDSRVVVFGEDVADVSREQDLPHVRGKGGVFKVTHGLQRAFGAHRVFNTPLAEANIVGRAFGMALRGMKPVVEIQFFDYIWPAMMHLRSEVALLRWRSNNDWSCPMVIRAAYGGYLTGGSIFHSQTGESIFTHIPGLRVVLPSNAADAAGLLRTAIRCEDPVLFLEHKHLYRQTYNRAPYAGPEHMVPFGKAALVTRGEDITVITYGALVRRSIEAQRQLVADGISLEIIDLRTLSPYDWDAIATSVTRTGRALVVHEESRSWGFGAEIAARIGEELFEYLDAPVRRVASLDTFVGYHPNLEDHILPQVADIVAAARALRAF
jgi:2-oxoisovalerate dehydrogenase E1 component